MKGEIFIIFASFLIVFSGAFFVFNISPSFTGFVVYNESSNYFINSNPIIITKELAYLAINNSHKIMDEMKLAGFSISYINDSILDAERVFEQAYYVDILKSNATEDEKLNAKNALKLVKWQNITYDDVLIFTEEIKKTKEKAYLLVDRISIEEKIINKHSSELSSSTLEKFNQAKIAFNEERYDDAKKLIDDFKISFDKEQAQFLGLNNLKNNSISFIQKYWIYILIILGIILVIIYIIYEKLKFAVLKKRILKMKKEHIVLTDLIKKTQEDRFKENKISGLVYNIRMKKYQERIQEIKQDLPVLEARLNKVTNKLKK